MRGASEFCCIKTSGSIMDPSEENDWISLPSANVADDSGNVGGSSTLHADEAVVDTHISDAVGVMDSTDWVILKRSSNDITSSTASADHLDMTMKLPDMEIEIDSCPSPSDQQQLLLLLPPPPPYGLTFEGTIPCQMPHDLKGSHNARISSSIISETNDASPINSDPPSRQVDDDDDDSNNGEVNKEEEGGNGGCCGYNGTSIVRFGLLLSGALAMTIVLSANWMRCNDSAASLETAMVRKHASEIRRDQSEQSELQSTSLTDRQAKISTKRQRTDARRTRRTHGRIQGRVPSQSTRLASAHVMSKQSDKFSFDIDYNMRFHDSLLMHPQSFKLRPNSSSQSSTSLSFDERPPRYERLVSSSSSSSSTKDEPSSLYSLPIPNCDMLRSCASCSDTNTTKNIEVRTVGRYPYPSPSAAYRAVFKRDVFDPDWVGGDRAMAKAIDWNASLIIRNRSCTITIPIRAREHVWSPMNSTAPRDRIGTTALSLKPSSSLALVYTKISFIQ